MNTITWGWTEDDIKAWCTAQVQTEAYQNHCKTMLFWCAFAGVVFALIFGMRNLTRWLELLLLVIVMATGAFLLGKVYLAIYMRRQLRGAIQQGIQSLSDDRSTIRIEQTGLRMILKDSEHFYQWSAVEPIRKLPGDFLHLRIREQDYHIPPSAFPDDALRNAFWDQLTRLKDSAGALLDASPWWQKQQNG